MPMKARQRSLAVSEEYAVKTYFDRIAPGMIRFCPDHYICGNYYKSTWAITEYPPSTEEMAILHHIADHTGVTVRIYNRLVDAAEQNKIIQHATRKMHLMSNTNDVTQSIKAQGDIQDVVELLSDMRRNKEPLLHCAVFLEFKAASEEKLKELESEIQMELTRSKISVDRLLLRQKEGFLSVLPTGSNNFGYRTERVLPASSVANLYPLSYSGKTDENGFYLGRDKFGTNIIVDFDKRTEDRTNSNVIILGNSGQASDDNNEFAMYSLAKFYLSDEKKDLSKAVALLEKVCNNEKLKPFAAYTYAKILLEDNEFHDTEKAVKLLKETAEDNNWCSFLLGKLYLFGNDDTERDKEKAIHWLTKSAEAGNEYAEALLQHSDDYEKAMLTNSIFGLFVSLSRMIEDDYSRAQHKMQSNVDRKLRHTIQRKKLA